MTSRGALWGLRVEYRVGGPSASSSGGSANLTTLGVCATASPSHPPCNTPLPGGFLADICLLHPPTYTPYKIDSNASLAPGIGGGPLPPSGGGPAWAPVPIRAAPCPSVRGRHPYNPVRRPPRRPPGRGVDRAPTSGGGPRVFPRPDAGPGSPITPWRYGHSGF